VSELLGAVVAGGRSVRFGRNKALARFGDATVIERVVAALRPVVSRLIVIANDPEPYRFLSLPIHFDLRPGCGALGGIHTAVAAGLGRRVLVVSCDLPLITTELLGLLASLADSADVVVPQGKTGIQPLCAVYGPACLPAIEARLERDELRVIGFYSAVQVRRIGAEELEPLGDEERLFLNINTPDEYQRALALAGLSA
jgi:molybdopterin-guanine dinucleotide biosynthesis protein A